MPSAHLGSATAALLAATALAACSSGTSLLSTGSTQPAIAAAPQPATPRDRATYAAATVAEAAKCGYNFDPVRLRANYVAWETQQGTPPQELAQLEQVYDTTRNRLSAGITKTEDFCTDDQTEKIKRNLSKQLAGDFSAPARKPEIPWWQNTKNEPAPIDREAIFNPRPK